MTNSKKFWKESFFWGISGLGDFFMELKTFAEIIKRTDNKKAILFIMYPQPFRFAFSGDLDL